MNPKYKPSTSPSTKPGSLFILQYKRRSVLIGSPTDYRQLQEAIRRHFPDIPSGHRVSYHTNQLAISKGAMVEVSGDIWESAIPLLNTLTVFSEPKASSSNSECDPSCDESPATSENQKISLTFFVVHSDKLVHVKCKSSMCVGDIISWCLPLLGVNPDAEHRVLYQGSEITEDIRVSLERYGMMDGDQIDVCPVLRGGKPVIYLFPPSGTEIHASVKLSLVPEWHFSGIYPIVPVDTLASGGQTLYWSVKASSDGTLLEKNTGLEVAYLFWEAEALAISTKPLLAASGTPSLISAGTSKASSDEAKFIPTNPRLDTSNSVVLEVANMTPYLDSALKVLGLHTEARTSFITYWLPSFLKHKHIALRFLPQSSYEHAAPLKISPAPDVVVRVFMLFKGLSEEEVSEGWNRAVEGDVMRWRRIVEIDENRSLGDGTLFRVVEWGGMEVLS